MSTLKFIALLRGINVGSSRRIPMTDLRVLCTALGWTGVRTYIQSGNVIFSADGAAAALEGDLEQALERRFGIRVPVIVRGAARWLAYVRSNPFPELSERHPNLVMLALSKSSPQVDAVERIRERATVEHVECRGDAVWIYYAGGSGRSKLTPALLDRSVGSPVTTRNWRTVLKLEQLVSS
jgi:uncharacterized protein (DUF1697 family)